jgi:acyl carrier protein
MSDTIDRVKKVTAEVLNIDTDRISETSRFVDDLGAESVQSIELIAAFEEEFEIEMDEGAALSLKTVADAVRYVEERIFPKTSSAERV